MPRIVGALILAGVFILLALNFIKQALAHLCVHQGRQQLSVCLSDDLNERVIVD
ncbi:hypothetical protein [Pseudomonas chlororaphis]|uniref:hypothetical protein n=1 Tax=Pseudomonas chlororaphis TaxID=587753 RepID=UPI0024085E88|nr:hypothetical protein [Pseudomonas chlororaphis]